MQPIWLQRVIAMLLAASLAALIACDEGEKQPPVPATGEAAAPAEGASKEGASKEGAEQQEGRPEHPAGRRAARFLDALKYGDVQTAARLHVESTSDGFYCRSESFRKALERAREKRSDEACREVDTVAGPALSEVDDAARLLVQLLAVVCEDPEADCADYGHRVLRANADTWPSWTRDIAAYRVVRTVDGERGTIVYVDLDRSGATEIDHRTLRMVEVGGEWYVAQRLLPDRVAGARSRPRSTAPQQPDFD